MTDHVTKQNRKLREDAGKDILLIAGQEMTNWFHGHVTVTGIEPGDHLDWRQRPEFGEFAVAEFGPGEARIEKFIAEARRLGAYVSAAHPTAPLPGLTWQFFADAGTLLEANPGRVPGFATSYRYECTRPAIRLGEQQSTGVSCA